MRSDSTTVSRGAVVFICESCCHLFKSPESVKENSNYDDYHLWNDSSQRDKVDFSAPVPTTRSGAILNFLKREQFFGRRTRTLDYGCNRGAFLSLLGDGKHAGYDVSEVHRAKIEKMGYDFYSPQKPLPTQAFDLLTLIHVYEHLNHWKTDMAPGLNALEENGHVFIQVPDPRRQPTDLYIMDHGHHFLPTPLNESLKQLGLSVCKEYPEDVVFGETSRLCKMDGGITSQGSPTTTKMAKSQARQILSILEGGESLLLWLKASPKKYFVYGRGLLGSFIADLLGSQVEGFIDDDPSVRSSGEKGPPVMALDQVPRQSEIVVAVQPVFAHRIAEKCRTKGHNPHVPFALFEAEISK